MKLEYEGVKIVLKDVVTMAIALGGCLYLFNKPPEIPCEWDPRVHEHDAKEVLERRLVKYNKQNLLLQRVVEHRGDTAWYACGCSSESGAIGLDWVIVTSDFRSPTVARDAIEYLRRQGIEAILPERKHKHGGLPYPVN